MIKNTRIRTQVAAAFGIIILLAISTIVWLLFEMNNLASTTQKLYQEPYAATNEMWSIRRNLIDTERMLNKLVGAEDSKLAQAYTATEQTLVSDSQNLQASISNLETVLKEPQELALLNEIKTIILEGEAIQKQVMALVQGGKRPEAYALMESTFEPLFETCNEKVITLFTSTQEDALHFVEESQSSSRTSIWVGIILLAAGLVVAGVITTRFAESITRPIHQLEEAAHQMTLGNLKAVNLITHTSRSEMGNLADSLRFTMTTLSTYVDEISAVLTRLAHGDLTQPSAEITDFLGDFAEIKQSLVTILKSFNNTLGEINVSAEQVDSGSNQVASAAQMLSQGATEQASSIEQLTATVEEISAQVRETATNAQQAYDFTSKVNTEVADSNHKMEEMSVAMAEISESSEQIGKIIKTIEDIAFQTNILALNAAVEAARAGAAGKGFAVVADEVRNLASKSAEASKSTASLIEHSVRAVENGTTIAAATAQSLAIVAETTRQVVDTVEHIAQASVLQAQAVDQVTAQVEDISSVVQTNSATAEESAAASEELSSQATMLSRLVSRFRLYGTSSAIRR